MAMWAFVMVFFNLVSVALKLSSTVCHTLSNSLLKPLQNKQNLAVLVLGWSNFKVVSDNPTLHSRWLLLLKNRNFLNYCFNFLFSLFCTDYVNKAYLILLFRNHWSKWNDIGLGGYLGGPLIKLSSIKDCSHFL